MRLIRCLLYGFVDYFSFEKVDRELGVRTATYGPGIDQSQHAKSVSHNKIIFINTCIGNSQTCILYQWQKAINL